ncbi:hypothetical protein D9M68_730070 [compost metagenome]|uniref:Uncharacterized protein n=1 Tax=Achromobacter agilis TaxID=1353888 RepID=A0A446CF32_9BURK|nr:hypothetical protein AGI3411_02544 [Achromobacter agilis]
MASMAATIPSLHAGEKWDAYEAARQAMAGHLSSNTVAPRYAAGPGVNAACPSA